MTIDTLYFFQNASFSSPRALGGTVVAGQTTKLLAVEEIKSFSIAFHHAVLVAIAVLSFKLWLIRSLTILELYVVTAFHVSKPT